jgi:hypothetical protein
MSPRWAGERGILYGHLHIHLLLPSLEIETRRGKRVTVLERGHMAVLDDPEVRRAAAEFGDPDQMLRADWQPGIPGITLPGDYAEYAVEPWRWIYSQS